MMLLKFLLAATRPLPWMNRYFWFSVPTDGIGLILKTIGMFFGLLRMFARVGLDCAWPFSAFFSSGRP